MLQKHSSYVRAKINAWFKFVQGKTSIRSNTKSGCYAILAARCFIFSVSFLLSTRRVYVIVGYFVPCLTRYSCDDFENICRSRKSENVSAQKKKIIMILMGKEFRSSNCCWWCSTSHFYCYSCYRVKSWQYNNRNNAKYWWLLMFAHCSLLLCQCLCHNKSLLFVSFILCLFKFHLAIYSI